MVMCYKVPQLSQASEASLSFALIPRVSNILTILDSSVGTTQSLVPVSTCATFSSVPVNPWWVTGIM